MLYNDILPDKKETRSVYQEIVKYLQNYKITLANEEVWTVVNQRLAKLLKIVNKKPFILLILLKK